jgi:hypothetical protein
VFGATTPGNSKVAHLAVRRFVPATGLLSLSWRIKAAAREHTGFLMGASTGGPRASNLSGLLTDVKTVKLDIPGRSVPVDAHRP